MPEFSSLEHYARKHFLEHLAELDAKDQSKLLRDVDLKGLIGVAPQPSTDRRLQLAFMIALSAVVVFGFVWFFSPFQAPHNLNAEKAAGASPPVMEVSKESKDVGADVILIRRPAYTVSYSTRLHLARWVAYPVMPGKGRTVTPILDPDLPIERQLTNHAYDDTPYFRGSLVRPSLVGGAADQSGVHFLSVKAPIAPKLNRGPLRSLDAEIGRRSDVTVVIGPVHQAKAQRDLIDGFYVPTHYFYALFKNGSMDVYLLENRFDLEYDNVRDYLASAIISQEKLNQLLGYDLLSELDESISAYPGFDSSD